MAKDEPTSHFLPFLQPDYSPPAAVLVDDAVSAQSDVVQVPLEESLEVITNPSSQKESNIHYHHPLRATALSFHAYSNHVDDVETSPIPTPQAEILFAQSASSTSQPIVPVDDKETSINGLYDGRGYASNLSSYPPPLPLSPGNQSSPTRSIYQGYAYDPGPAGYSPHIRSSPQYSQSFQSQFETFVSPGHQYVQHSPYHGHMPSFSALENQAPLTPSATPLDAMPEPWKMPNRSSNLSSDCNASIAFQPRYRSDSRSTLRSDNFPSGGTGGISGNSRASQNGIYNSHAAEENIMYDRFTNYQSDGASLVGHLLRHFNDASCADCEIVLTHDTRRFRKTQWSLNSILIIQSRTLQELLKISKPIEDGKRLMELRVRDRFVTPASMDYALRVLYGMPPNTLLRASLDEDSPQTESSLSMSSMKESLAYVATGCLLDLRGVVLRGLRLACDILTWDNLEMALSFALQSSLGRDELVPSSMVPTYSPSLARGSNPSSSSRVVFTPSSGSNPIPQQSHNPSSISLPGNFPRPLPQFPNDLLPHCLDFMIYNFPTSFELDLTARPLANLNRLPVTAESRSPLARSRLSRIQFGDHPSEAATKSNDSNVLLSSILLSVPFVQLNVLLRSVGKPLDCSIGPIIKERENRRQIVLQSTSVSWSERIAASTHEWAEAGYEESMEMSDDGTMKISRRFTGIAGSSADGDTIDQPAEKV